MVEKQAKPQSRVESLVFEFSPLDASALPQLYFSKYNEGLDYKKLGHSKLKDMIATLQSIKMESSNGSNVLLVWCGDGAKGETLKHPDAISSNCKWLGDGG